MVLFYAARENSCVSNERLPKKNVYVPLKRCYVISFRDVKTLPHKRIFTGVKPHEYRPSLPVSRTAHQRPLASGEMLGLIADAFVRLIGKVLG